jgi:DNA-binding response OmpR family regulator
MTARAAKDALKKMKDFRPHAILLDIVMPGLDGLEMLRTIRRYNRNLPVFMITAFSNEDRFRLARKLKASGFIVKTGDLKREVDNINGLLNISHRYKGSLASSACKRKRK